MRLLLKKGAKLDLNTKNVMAQEKIRNMSEGVKREIDEHECFKRIMPFLKHHKHREQSHTYPEEFKGINKTLMTKMISEYM